MQIQIDSREHKSERERIERQFDKLGVEHFCSKLYVGDYMLLDNPRFCIDRKKDLQELCGNVCQQHERFRAELLRAQKAGIRLVILCEHGPDIQDLTDVYFWDNPRRVEWERKLRLEHWEYHTLSFEGMIDHLLDDGVPRLELMPPISGKQLYKSLETIHQNYNVDIFFCEKKDTGKTIVDILGGAYEG